VSVSIVIVSFNAREHLERCLDAVAGAGHEVVVVDNASSDGSPVLVRERFPSVRLVELEENLGAVRVQLTPAEFEEIDTLSANFKVQGERYPAHMLKMSE